MGSLSPSDIDLFKSLLGQLVHDSKSLAAVDAALDKTKSLPLALQSVVGQKSGKADPTTQKLRLLGALYDIADGNVPLIKAILNEPGVQTLQDVATKFYVRRQVPVPLDSTHWASFRSKLFAREPTAVLCALISSDTICAAPDLKSEIVQVLSASLPDFDISRTSIVDLLQDAKIVGKVPKEKLAPVSGFLKELQRLQALIEKPEDVNPLLTASFKSAHMIANTPIKSFLMLTTNAGLSADAAKRIHDHAVAVDLRSEHMFIAAQQAKTKLTIAAVNRPSTVAASLKPSLISTKALSRATEPAPASMPTDSINLDTIFADMDEEACPDCQSVTSLSAYFVDLMRMLKNTPVDPSILSVSLLDKLSERRPDLKNLELSCANSNTLIPYIDLVNEIMESSVKFLATGTSKTGPIPIDVYNTSDSDTSASQIAEPQHVNFDVYTDAVQKQMCPLNVFPYNQAIDSFQLFMATFKSSRYELLASFASSFRLAAQYRVDTTKSENLAPFQPVLDRALVAESLGLLEADYMAITKESFWPTALVGSLSGNANLSDSAYRLKVGMPSDSQFWGYDTDALLLDDLTGLCVIEAQLLPRSGLIFSELVSIVNARCFGGTLSISLRQLVDNSTSKTQVSTKLKDMRLCDKSGGALTVSQWDQLSRFIRLWRKVGWSITAMDEALLVFGTNMGGVFGITTSTVDAIAAVKEINTSTGVDVLKLLPLWGPIGLPLYTRLFLSRRNRPGSEFDVFTLSVSNQLQSTNSPLCSQVVSAALQLSPQNLTTIKDQENLQNVLSLKNLSLVYGISVWCKILGIAVDQYADFDDIFDKPLSTPRKTASVLALWTALKGEDWTFPKLLSILKSPTPSQASSAPPADDVLAISSLVSGFADFENEYPDFTAPNAIFLEEKATSDYVAKISTLMFGAVTGADITQFIEHATTQKFSVPVKFKSTTPPTVTIPSTLVGKVVYSPPTAGAGGSLSLTGILAGDEKQSLLNAATPATPPDDAWETAVQTLDNLSRAPFDIILKPYFSSDDSKTQAKLLPTVPDTQDSLIDRRSYYLSRITASLKNKLEEQLILDTFGIRFPDVDPSIFRYLMSRLPVSDDLSASAHILRKLSPSDMEKQISTSSTSVDGYFTPPSTDSYDFIFRGSGDPPSFPSFLLNDQEKPFLEQPTGERVVTANLVKGQQYKLTFLGPPSDLKWRTHQDYQKELSPTVFLAKSLVLTVVGTVFAMVSKAATVINIFNLKVDEIDYIQTKGIQLTKAVQQTKGSQPKKDIQQAKAILAPIAFNNFDFDDLMAIRAYSSLRDSLTSSSNATLLDLFGWASSSTPSIVAPPSGAPSNGASGSSLSSQIALVTGWPEPQVAGLLDARYPCQKENTQRLLFQNHVELTKLAQAVKWISKTGLSQTDIKTIFQWAEPVKFGPDGASRLAQDAFQLRAILPSPLDTERWTDALSSANDKLRVNQRQALVGYLLQQPRFKDPKVNVVDADSLLGYFLIDVQMGSCLQTSRMRQAVSTIQLFVSRCMLGLEGFPGAAIDQEFRNRWNWMQRYRLWEANRQVFLYPENWTDPSLRDNKTELFSALETAMMQDDANIDSAIQAVKAYVYGVNEVADLDIQAYLWQSTASFRGRFHAFGRSKSVPFRYYYRYMDMAGPDAQDPYVAWSPWEKIQIDILTLEADPEGFSVPQPGSYLVPFVWKNRLYLFLPQIALKKAQKKSPQVKDQLPPVSIKNLSDGTPADLSADKYWEIKLAFSEYRDGQWSSKQTPTAFLKIPVSSTDTAGAVSDASRFRFWCTPQDEILVIDVESWVSLTQILSQIHGSFEMRGSQIVAITAKIPDTLSTTTVQTTFGKLSQHLKVGSDITAPGVMPHGDNKTNRPLVGAVPFQKDSDFTWTISYDEFLYSRPTGFITEVDGAEAHGSRTYFSFPPNRKIIGKDPPLVNTVMNHLVSPTLMEGAVGTGMDDIFKALSSSVPSELVANAFGRFNGPFSELATPYAIYNWELGVHVVSLLMERFLATQQFDVALQIARYAFDPTAAGADVRSCWLFPPFQDDNIRVGEGLTSVLDSLKPSSGADATMVRAIAEWRRHPFLAHSVARSRPVAYMKRIAMKYIEILIASGDDLFRQQSLETLPLAIQRYIEASHVFGPAPQQISRVGTTSTKTYNDLDQMWNDFSDAAVDMELQFPFITAPDGRGSSTGGASTSILLGFVQTEYFCVPVNPNLASLRQTIDDRLRKIRNCLDINGNPLHLPLLDPPIDPGQLVKMAALGLNPSSVLSELDSALPNYRYKFLIEKAFEMCGELKQFSDQFLSVKEKKDSEALSALKARQDSVMETMILDLKKSQRDEAKKAIEELQESRRGPVSRLQYYIALTGDSTVAIPGEDDDFTEIDQNIDKPTTDDLRMSNNEALEISSSIVAQSINQQAAATEITASALFAVPDTDENGEPLGCGVTVKFGSQNIAQMMMVLAGVQRFSAQDSLNQGELSAKKATLIRQLQDRRLQANIAGREIKNIDKQIATAKFRLASAELEIKNQQKQIENTNATEKYLRTKYTNKELYTWMDNSVRTLFFQAYRLATDLAKKAEKAYRFERGVEDTSFINPGGYWDSSRDGMFCAENLYLDLKKLESANFDAAPYDFEVVKNVSLRQTRPRALLKLRETGSVEFDVPEVLFDLDFPGHYQRRIKSVSVTMPCVVGPYTTVNCTLTLTKSKYRVNALATAANYADSGDDNNNTSSTFRTSRTPISSIAVSSGQSDAGVFQLDFQSERYMPFEGAGAVSNWRLEFPNAVFRQFDYSTITDVILQIRYTSLNGGMTLRDAAMSSLTSFFNSIDNLTKDQGLFAVIDVKSEASAAFSSFNTFPKDDTMPRTFKINNILNRLPFYTRGKPVKVQDVVIMAVADPNPDLDPSTATVKMDGVDGAFTTDSDLGANTFRSKSGLALTLGPKDEWSFTFALSKDKLVFERLFLVFRYTLSVS